ncbi:phospholipase A2 inhibitor NAI-like [Bombina bombina]|uniref:phospholipase A2 inhibitor NAI-like n=1 Tax=Bombina bombina TaxID=8345 RepID=UPI00235A8D9A|nr:phospholipase A2 inhibitor NAI-like [Bombina bombina]
MCNGFCIVCVQCITNDALTCNGLAHNCTGNDTVCMSVVTETSTAVGKTTTTFERSCGNSFQCLIPGSMTSFKMSTRTNNTCCYEDFCSPKRPMLPLVNMDYNDIQCKTCFAHDVKECSDFGILDCTGDEQSCVKYTLTDNSGFTFIWGCSTKSFCRQAFSQQLISGQNLTVSAECSDDIKTKSYTGENPAAY